MKKSIQKHIDKEHYVKLELTNSKDKALCSFGGYIIAQNKHFILFCDFMDFHYDGMVIIKKKDVAEIRYSDFEKQLDKMKAGEGIKQNALKRVRKLNVKLGTYPEILEQIKAKDLAIIIEDLYGNKDYFQIGPIEKIGKKAVKLHYMNAKGYYEFKPVKAYYTDITFTRFDGPYATLFYKYSQSRE